MRRLFDFARLRLALLGFAVIGCEPAPDPPEASAPVTAQAGLVIEPPLVTVGKVLIVEVAVVTPPDHRVPPVRPPDHMTGFWLLDAEPLAIRRDAGRWVHRTRIRARAREVGRFEWPAQEVTVERPDGSTLLLELAAHPIEVVSVLPETPMGLQPYTLRAPPSDPWRPTGFLLPAATGAFTALAAVGVISWWRRRGQATASDAADAMDASPRRWIAGNLEDALLLVDEDPRRAADEASTGLRHYLASRYGIDAEFRTTEELAGRRVPFAATTRWTRYLEVLKALDGSRFPARTGSDEGSIEALRETIRKAQALVHESAPGGAKAAADASRSGS